MGWLLKHFEKYRLLGDYFDALKRTWLEIIFGESLVAIIFLIVWSLKPDLSTHKILWFFISALLIAGYHIWYVDHVRLIPKLELGDVRIVKTPTTDNRGRRGADRVVGQIIVKRLTDASIEDCRGQLLRVWKWSEPEKAWGLTDVDEPQALKWSIVDQPVRTLDADQQLNLFHIDSATPQITLSVPALPHRVAAVFAGAGPDDVYKFDISVIGKDCPSVETSVRVQMGVTWDSPALSRIAEISN
jgi:hypothetical protein